MGNFMRLKINSVFMADSHTIQNNSLMPYRGRLKGSLRIIIQDMKLKLLCNQEELLPLQSSPPPTNGALEWSSSTKTTWVWTSLQNWKSSSGRRSYHRASIGL